MGVLLLEVVHVLILLYELSLEQLNLKPLARELLSYSNLVLIY